MNELLTFHTQKMNERRKTRDQSKVLGKRNKHIFTGNCAVSQFLFLSLLAHYNTKNENKIWKSEIRLPTFWDATRTEKKYDWP
ncbi:hypothetical protein, partial [Hoylesella pleuritidis]|uniref:hypothetical protein n=1 Tax=Hoylesella pleuritidis TaxID=407975 RepID=UPI002353CDFC